MQLIDLTELIYNISIETFQCHL